MKQCQISDFELFCEKAHLQILLIHWIVDRLAARQQSGNPAIDRIEQDFIQHCARFNQPTDFRFDRGDSLLMVAHSIFVSGVEAVERHPEKSKIVSKIELEIGDYASVKKLFEIDVSNLKCLACEQQPSTWTVIKRLRNSLSHFRWEYSDTGRIKFVDQLNETETANFSMDLSKVLALAYRFGRACVSIRQNWLNTT